MPATADQQQVDSGSDQPLRQKNRPRRRMINTPDAARPDLQQQESQQQSPSRRGDGPSIRTRSVSTAWIKTGLVALPIYGLILAITTRTPQPDQSLDPEGWAQPHDQLRGQ
jgi:hypothetical protein